jgi:hypothetical protein
MIFRDGDLGLIEEQLSGQAIISSAAGPVSGAALAAIKNDNGVGAPIEDTFDGQQTSAADVLVKFTYLGDTNLDGNVNVADLANLAGNFGVTAGANWLGGDFDSDGNVNVADLADLAGNFGKTLGGGGAAAEAHPQELTASAASNVPEPSTFGLAMLAAFSPLCRRHRRAASA